ncbi:FAD-dependent oxidoreductase [Hoyosella altamirensis]|uniref:Glycine/D-amino acid oxidase-like deaminating enzyme/nitrite reductase/ring-hydroxylating ferredoxin subunit n=1 Tax=Hoyosella altamirensis TaxID=616997 RepID=A0A839RSE8_9ACTN|nr:FAD-dependent oxidoreductase [Hoyosella altamirensis]MBB3038791.1 glycine/D-amino acid oxidase-like deaminating enzyme/nitrite reductase/ring-hydroxylating ferredoxin subunit [Hoyosella altamirensis]
MTSLWLETRKAPAAAELHTVDTSTKPDVVIVGAGVTGLVCGLECARAGLRVAVLDARGVAEVTTGLTTAKASCLQGAKTSEIVREHGSEAAREYVAVNQSALSWLREFCAGAGVEIQTRAAYTIAQHDSSLETLEREADAASAAGLKVDSSRGAPLDFAPFPIAGFVGLNDQAQFNPVELADALASQIRELGGGIYQGIRAEGVSTSGTLTVHTTHGDIVTDRVVLATGTPILDRGGFFAKLEPQRSYLAAFAVPSGTLQPEGMYVSIDSPEVAPTRSLRSAPGHLLVGGNGHVVGRAANTRVCARDLLTWTSHYFPEVAPTQQWSAQDYSSVDGLPVVGALTPASDKVLIASGYAKWGMTNGVAAGRILAERISGSAAKSGGTLPGTELFDSQRSLAVRRLPNFTATNAKVGMNAIKSWAQLARTLPQAPAEGEGVVHRHQLKPVATSTVDGETRTVSAICPHLKALLCWNSAERSWDCPLHGSRFNADGTLLEGPATRDLAAAPSPEWKGS